MKKVTRNLSLVLMAVCALSISSLFAQQSIIDNWRSYGQQGVNVFEDPQTATTEYNGPRVRVGGAFTQQLQALSHSYDLVDADNDGVFENELYDLKTGFNLATANLNIDAQLGPGVRLNLITYLSSRHHPEAWVKGVIQFDELPFLKSSLVDRIMDKVRIRVGHMEINYGDAHCRRSDNGNTIYNPIVGNYIADAFNTEIGGEIYYFNKGFIAMASLTGGELSGNVTSAPPGPEGEEGSRAPSIIGKLGYDKQVNDDLRVRVTGSIYTTASSAVNHLYSGDRSGSRYYLVMAPPGVGAGDRGIFPSGRYSPGFTDAVTATMFNAFAKFKGLETFITVENTSGRTWVETDTRTMNQFAGELIYRFGTEEDVFLGARYNTVSSTEPSGTDVSINRYQISAGWFLTDNILLKGEYINQDYNDFAPGSLLSNGNFNGFMIEAAVGF